MTAALCHLPEGQYSFTDFMELGEDDVRIRVTVTIADGRLTSDFTGSDDQVASNFNAVEAVTRSCLYYAVRVATDPTIPANGGSYRPIALDVPDLGVGEKVVAPIHLGRQPARRHRADSPGTHRLDRPLPGPGPCRHARAAG